MDAKTIMQIIKTNKIVIYGNGYIAKRLYNLIQKLGYTKNVLNIAVTKVASDDIGINGVKLIPISDVDRDVLILLAVHNAVAAEMEKNLQDLGFRQFIWIYPYLFEMEIGQPIRKHQQIKIVTLIDRAAYSYELPIYYLTLKDYCTENIYNGKLYVKFFSAYVTTEMAEKRWQKFQQRIEECLKEGFQQDHSIKVNEDYYLMDGAHRLVLAKYFHKDTVFVDVYAGHGEFYSAEGLGGDVFLKEPDLPRYYTPDEIADIEATNRELQISW